MIASCNHTGQKKMSSIFSEVFDFFFSSLCPLILDTTGENIAESLVNEGLATVRREGIRGNK